MNDIIGYTAMALNVISFTFSKQRYIRLLSLASCGLWIEYGWTMGSAPIIVANILISIIHVAWFIRHDTI